MKNNKSLSIIVVLLLVVAFTLGSFILPVEKNLFFWNGYGFMMVSFGLFVYVLYHWNHSNQNLKSKFLGMPLLVVAYRFLLLSLIWAFINYILAFQILPSIYSYTAIIISIVIFGFGISTLLVTQVGTNIVNSVEEKMRMKVNFIRSTQLEVELLVNITSDNVLQKRIKALSEEIRYSDPMSHSTLLEIEEEITKKISVLKSALGNKESDAESLISEISGLLKERNKIVMNQK